jgi:hypothetical protein
MCGGIADLSARRGLGGSVAEVAIKRQEAAARGRAQESRCVCAVGV